MGLVDPPALARARHLAYLRAVHSPEHNGHATPPLDLGRGLLSERAQRLYLVATGVVLFGIGAAILALESPEVSHEVRIAGWPARLEGVPAPLRATGVERTRHRLSPVALCAGGAPDGLEIGPSSFAPRLPLILRAAPGVNEARPCLDLPGRGTWELALRLPPERKATELNTLPDLKPTDVSSGRADPSFPMAHIAVPEGGSFNPRARNPVLLVWIEGLPAEGSNVMARPARAQAVPVTPDSYGLYALPLRAEGIGATVAVEVHRQGQAWSRSFRLGLRPAELALQAWRSAKEARVTVERTSSAPDTLRALCVLHAGAAALDAKVVEIPQAVSSARLRFPLPASPPELLYVACHPGISSGGPDSVSALVLPGSGFTSHAAREALWPALRRAFVPSEARRLRGWLEDPDPNAQARAARLIAAAIQPTPPRPIRLGSSYEADLATAQARYDTGRRGVFAIFILLLLSWAGTVAARAVQQRRRRREALAAYLAEGPDDDGSDALIAAGPDALVRPGSQWVAAAVLGVLALSIAGLLWVLWAL